MNIHKIDNHLHHSFLEEERKDAVTGDLIQANDEVVFCGMCKSAFLKYSWEYMDRKHCGQSKTLKSVPVSKSLLLNVSLVKPAFITLTNVSTSLEECLKLLTSFNPKNKKVNILVDFSIKRGTQEYSNLVEKTKIKIQKANKEITTKSEDDESTLGCFMIVLVLFFVSIGIIYLIPKDYAVFEIPFILIAMVTGVFFTVLVGQYIEDLFKKIKFGRKKRKKIPKRISLGNLENKFEFKDSITFGIFNHSLFLYFEELQQAIFIEIAKVQEVEIRYKSHCYLLLVLKNYEIASQEIEIPLVFTKNSRVTKFLMKLASFNKEISKPSKIILANFPTNQKKALQNSLKFYPDITFIENEHT
jgi:hypothetical protein